ncbi:myosin-11-like [Diaphorina citri]|uniref:Myosin-11-like n=1 Tax=Diaphorina citri TaxID=121845 RepID=A0A3Q0J549_DIACI|nr:myosin-11-like [Diaphorina citri]
MATQSASLDKMETLSTSTISKADETNRMKDIEDTYEDRYMKLKLLTIKYKKSYVETNEKLTTLTNENAALMSKLQALTNQIKTTQILQSEYDSLCEKQDADARTLKSNAKFIAQLTHDKETLENSLRSLRTQLNDASTQKSDALAKYASLKEKFDEKQVSDIIMKDKDHEIAKLTDTNTHLSEQIVELRTRIAQCTSRNVDIAQCERQLDEAKVRISELETKLEAMEEMSQTLNTVQENYTALKLSHSQLEADHKVSLSQLSALSESYQAAKSRTEELLVDNTQLCRDRDRLEEATRVRNELTSQLTGVEMQLNEVKADKARLEKEFETYKRKAQSVLEKHKKGQLDATSASTEENNGKLLALEKQVDDLKTELNQSQQELSRARQSLATTASENTALASQLHRVRDDLSASAQSLAQAKEDKMNADLLATMYRQQVEEQGTRIKELKATVAGLREEVAKLAKTDVKDERIVEKKLEVEVDDRRRMEEVLSANNLTNMASLYREEGEVNFDLTLISTRKPRAFGDKGLATNPL